jgi:hypothetical protein
MLSEELVALRDLLPSPLDAKFARFFEEYIEHHEFGLALDCICDYLLEPATQPTSASILGQIEKLRGLMKVEDDCIAKLRIKASGG